MFLTMQVSADIIDLNLFLPGKELSELDFQSRVDILLWKLVYVWIQSGLLSIFICTMLTHVHMFWI